MPSAPANVNVAGSREFSSASNGLASPPRWFWVVLRTLRTAQKNGLSAAQQAFPANAAWILTRIKRGLVGRAQDAFFFAQEQRRSVDSKKGWSLYTRLGSPPALGRDGVPMKLLTGTVKRYPTVLGCAGFDGPSVRRRVGIAAASAKAFRLFEN
jgi:hypothetical protein